MERMGEDHDRLIKEILDEEEDLLKDHKSHIDSLVALVKEDCALLDTVEKPSSDVEQYIHQLDAVLLKKVDAITQLRKKVVSFYTNLEKEKQLIQLYHRADEQKEITEAFAFKGNGGGL